MCLIKFENKIRNIIGTKSEKPKIISPATWLAVTFKNPAIHALQNYIKGLVASRISRVFVWILLHVCGWSCCSHPRRDSRWRHWCGRDPLGNGVHPAQHQVSYGSLVLLLFVPYQRHATVVYLHRKEKPYYWKTVCQ